MWTAPNSTALAQHAHTFQHTFVFKEVKILEHEQNLIKKLPRNDLYKKKINSINFRTDIENLNDIYSNII